jgi:hypothetical protein
MHQFSQIYFGIELNMFWTGLLSVIIFFLQAMRKNHVA